jgi:hypothetical protein
VAVADFDGDGHPDLAAANSGGGTVSVLLNDGHGGFGPRADYAVGSRPFSVAVGDFDRDGDPDLATANLDGGGVSVLLNTTVWSAPELIDRVADGVPSLNLPGDAARGLSNKLDAAKAALDRGNDTAARQLIESAIRQLENLVRAGKLDAAEADPLIADLEAALALL